MPQRHTSTLQGNFPLSRPRLIPVHLGQLIERDRWSVLLADGKPAPLIHVLVGVEPDTPRDLVIRYEVGQLVDADSQRDEIVRVMLVDDLLKDVVGNHDGSTG